MLRRIAGIGWYPVPTFPPRRRRSRPLSPPAHSPVRGDCDAILRSLGAVAVGRRFRRRRVRLLEQQSQRQRGQLEAQREHLRRRFQPRRAASALAASASAIGPRCRIVGAIANVPTDQLVFPGRLLICSDYPVSAAGVLRRPGQPDRVRHRDRPGDRRAPGPRRSRSSTRSSTRSSRRSPAASATSSSRPRTSPPTARSRST